MTDKKILAERIARLLDGELPSGDLASVFASIEKINHRLDKLESALPHPRSEASISPSVHPSQEKYAVLEAVADQIIEGLKNEKACSFEPAERPCDHCSMCSSRGF
ncbi:MAG: hypothetical protein AB7Q37_18350 [Pyrinomonadaceae bacterium]